MHWLDVRKPLGPPGFERTWSKLSPGKCFTCCAVIFDSSRKRARKFASADARGVGNEPLTIGFVVATTAWLSFFGGRSLMIDGARTVYARGAPSTFVSVMKVASFAAEARHV